MYGNDVFTTDKNTTTTLYSMILYSSLDYLTLDFTFGTFYSPVGAVWYHSQLTLANNYNYNFYKAYVENDYDNGTKLVINANGGDGANNANWKFQYYKF